MLRTRRARLNRAAALPKGSEERRDILASLQDQSKRAKIASADSPMMKTVNKFLAISLAKFGGDAAEVVLKGNKLIVGYYKFAAYNDWLEEVDRLMDQGGIDDESEEWGRAYDDFSEKAVHIIVKAEGEMTRAVQKFFGSTKVEHVDTNDGGGSAKGHSIWWEVPVAEVFPAWP
jgi:hypothetical protein